MADLLEPLQLGAEFPAATREEWLRLVAGVLKGASIETLVSKTYDGVPIEPLYARVSGAVALDRPTSARWRIMQRVDHPDPEAANAEALHELESGATGLTLVFAESPSANGYGIPGSAGAIASVLDCVRLDAGIALDLDFAPGGEAVAQEVAALVTARGHRPESVDIRFGLDPLGAAASGGHAPLWDRAARAFASRIGRLAAEGFKGPLAAADGRIIHAAGGSEAQELAFIISVGVSYLRALEGASISLEAARRMITFRMASDADQLLSIAKLRALRRLWARVEAACGIAPRPAVVSAETAWRMMTQRDPHVNTLRTTLAAFSAAVGGADAITVLPFTAALGLPDRSARRLARNTQLMLAEESNLAKVADPAAGAGALEALTAQLCRTAWTLFQEIEAMGGAAAAIESGWLRERVALRRAERERAVAHRKDALTGTTEFPDVREMPIATLDVEPVTSRSSSANPLTALPRMRLAAPFEALRDASDQLLVRTGARPRAFLANLGRPADFLARSTFARNFFEAGGIEAIGSDGFVRASEGDGSSTDLVAMAAAFKASAAKLACLCSSDAVYAREAVKAAAALRGAGAAHVYLVGRPREARTALEAAGVGSFIYAGCDALAMLVAAHERIEGTAG